MKLPAAFSRSVRTPAVVTALALASALPVPAAVAAPVPAGPAAARAADPAFDFTAPKVLATNLTVPWGLAFLPDGSALISERTSARILELAPGSTTPTEVAKLTGPVSTGEGGLPGIAVSPTYEQDGYVHAYYTSSSDNRIVAPDAGARPHRGGEAGLVEPDVDAHRHPVHVEDLRHERRGDGVRRFVPAAVRTVMSLAWRGRAQGEAQPETGGTAWTTPEGRSTTAGPRSCSTPCRWASP